MLWLADGDYPYTTLAAAVSNGPEQRKHLRPMGDKAVFHGLQLAASYWDIEGIGVTSKSFSISGSHNLINRVTARQADDTGIWIASPPGIGRALWASYNTVSHSSPGEIKIPA